MCFVALNIKNRTNSLLKQTIAVISKTILICGPMCIKTFNLFLNVFSNPCMPTITIIKKLQEKMKFSAKCGCLNYKYGSYLALLLISTYKNICNFRKIYYFCKLDEHYFYMIFTAFRNALVLRILIITSSSAKLTGAFLINNFTALNRLRIEPLNE